MLKTYLFPILSWINCLAIFLAAVEYFQEELE
jgi:hypothetical protein